MAFEDFIKLDFAPKVWKFLIADDVVSHRQALIKSLRNYPVSIEFTEASSAEEAIEALASNTYDIAFLDVFFPAYQVLRRSKLHERRDQKPSLPSFPALFPTILLKSVGNSGRMTISRSRSAMKCCIQFWTAISRCVARNRS